MYTDGITDVRPPFGLDQRALNSTISLAAATPGTAESVADRLGEAVTEILPLPERGDDVALVVLRIAG